MLTTSSSIAVSWSTKNAISILKSPDAIHSYSVTWYSWPPKMTFTKTTMLIAHEIATSRVGIIQDR